MCSYIKVCRIPYMLYLCVMKINYKLAYICLIVSLLVFVSYSCALKNKSNSEQALRLGFMPNITHAAALVGIEKKIFQEELGSDVKFTPVDFIVGNSIIDAFITNQLDAAYVGPGPFINALDKGVPLKLLSDSAYAGTLLVGAKNVLDIKPGMKIAVPQYGNTQDLILRLFLRKKGLSEKVKIIAIPPQDTGTAFYSMSIDAACLPEPWGSILIERKACNLLVNERDILNNGNYPVTLLVIDKRFASHNPKLVQSLLKAHKKVTDYIVNSPDEAILTIAIAISNLTKKEIEQNIIDASFKRCIFKSGLNKNNLDSLLEEFKIEGTRAGY